MTFRDDDYTHLTPGDHFHEAEVMLAGAERVRHHDLAQAELMLAAAQVHAILATVEGDR